MRPKNDARNTARIKHGLANKMYSDGKKRRSFVSLLFVAGDLRRLGAGEMIDITDEYDPFSVLENQTNERIQRILERNSDIVQEVNDALLDQAAKKVLSYANPGAWIYSIFDAMAFFVKGDDKKIIRFLLKHGSSNPRDFQISLCLVVYFCGYSAFMETFYREVRANVSIPIRAVIRALLKLSMDEFGNSLEKDWNNHRFKAPIRVTLAVYAFVLNSLLLDDGLEEGQVDWALNEFSFVKKDGYYSFRELYRYVFPDHIPCFGSVALNELYLKHSRVKQFVVNRYGEEEIIRKYFEKIESCSDILGKGKIGS